MIPEPKHLKISSVSGCVADVGAMQRRKLKGLGRYIPCGDPSGAPEGYLEYVGHTVSVTRP